MSSVKVVWLLNSRVYLTPGVYGSATTESQAEPDGSLSCPTPSPPHVHMQMWLWVNQQPTDQAHLLGVNVGK